MIIYLLVFLTFYVIWFVFVYAYWSIHNIYDKLPEPSLSEVLYTSSWTYCLAYTLASLSVKFGWVSF